MAFPEDLLEQAQHLATRDPRRPKRANLRRAVSTAYYALFHLLVSEAVGNWRIEPQRNALARAFEHGRMKKACNNCKSGNANLMDVADAFVELQDARHKADYDNAIVLTRLEAVKLIERAESAFRHWRVVRGTREAQDLLLSMLTDRK
jgi:uncharacterized protein (UPF0332 family)